MNPCDFILWGYLKELVYKPLPDNLQDLRKRITGEFSNLFETMAAKAVFGMKLRSLKLLKTGGEAFEGKNIRLCSESDSIMFMKLGNVIQLVSSKH